MKQVASVTVFSKPSCVQCVATTRSLDTAKIGYETVDLTRDADAMANVQSLGYRQAPVIITYDAAGDVVDHWAGFQPNKIDSLRAMMPEAIEAETPQIG